MAFHQGKDSVFTIDSDNLTTFLTDVSLDRSVDEAETSTMGSESKTFLPGMDEATISISGRYDPTASTGPDAVLAPLVGSDTLVTFEYGPHGSTSTNVKYSGSCFVTSYNVSSPVADIVAFSATMRVSGAVTRGTYA